MELSDILAAPNWLICLLIILTTIYFFSTRNHGYWKSVGVPTPPVYPLFGSILSNFGKDFHLIDMIHQKKLGRTYGIYEGTRPTLVLGDPDLLRDVLVKDFHVFTNRRTFPMGDPISEKMLSVINGEDWKRIRTILTPAFSSGKMRKMCSIINNCADITTENFLAAAKKDAPVDVKSLFGAYTMDVIASSAFGTRIDSHKDPENPLVVEARKVFKQEIGLRFLFIFLIPPLAKLLGQTFFLTSVVHYFRDIVLKLVEERRTTGKTRNDFLQLMIDAEKEAEFPEVEEKDEDSHYGHEEENSKVFERRLTTKTLSRDELVAQCVLFFIAGYDTTASTISFVAYNLAFNPECQERLIQEVDETYLEYGEVDYDILKKMKYLDQVVSETLRMYPPAVRTERAADRDYTLSGTNIVIPKGRIVSMPIYAIHHNPENYPDPEKFDPERFSPENRNSRHPYSYLPFGAGPRNCAALRFALMEIKLCLAKICRQVRFYPCSETKVPLQFYRSGILSPKDVTLKIKIRTDAPQPKNS